MFFGLDYQDSDDNNLNKNVINIVHQQLNLEAFQRCSMLVDRALTPCCSSDTDQSCLKLTVFDVEMISCRIALILPQALEGNCVDNVFN